MDLTVIDAGVADYHEAFDVQKSLRDQRIAGRIGDTLILLEHPPVITLGRRAESRDILISEERAKSRGVKIVTVDRGGEVTYHGPGQLVGYFIVHLSAAGGSIRRFVENIEESVILLAADYGLPAGRDRDHRGVWVDGEKLAAIGLSVSRMVTMHGFALNVNTDLSHFSWIVPCGIRDKGVTSMKKLLGRETNYEEVKNGLLEKIRSVFGFERLVRRGKQEVFHG